MQKKIIAYDISMQDKSLMHFNTISSLDTLRFGAFLLVFLSHSILFLPDVFPGWVHTWIRHYLVIGDLGVSIFFVLSGFLITTLLLTETKRAETVSIISFYKKRILRIWPLYFLIVLLGAVIIPYVIPGELFMHPYTIHGVVEWWRLGTFTFNLGQYPDFISVSLILGVLWSLSVEEQFYLVWPWCIKYLNLKQKGIQTLLLIVIVIATIFRYVHADNRSIVEYHTFSVMSDIAMGGLFSSIYVMVHESIRNLERYKAWIIQGISFTIVSADIIFRQNLFQFKLFIALEPIIFAIAVVGILISLLQYSVSSFFNNRVLVYLGKISYGLYMYHIIAMIIILSIAQKTPLPAWVQIAGSLVVVIILASISYQFFEKPILSLKKRWVSTDSVSF
jgi:peptidoglycan/LPS O-acetylase OafA/YrhL